VTIGKQRPSLLRNISENALILVRKDFGTNLAFVVAIMVSFPRYIIFLR
jgi:hypothetical protein